jgi:hypothetical protein
MPLGIENAFRRISTNVTKSTKSIEASRLEARGDGDAARALAKTRPGHPAVADTLSRAAPRQSFSTQPFAPVTQAFAAGSARRSTQPADFVSAYLQQALGSRGAGDSLRRGAQGLTAMGVAAGLVAMSSASRASLGAYLARMGQHGTEGGLPELYAMSQAAQLQIDVYKLSDDGGSISRAASMVPANAESRQRIALLDDGHGLRAMFSNPKETDDSSTQPQAHAFTANRFLEQPRANDGHGVFGAVALLTEIDPKVMRGLACGYMADHWDEQTPLFAGRSLGEAAQAS